MKRLILPAAVLALLACGNRPKPAVPAGDKTVSTVLTLTAATFPAVKAQGKPVLVDFWAPWCGPCRTQGPIVEDVAQGLGDKAVVAKVNVDDERELASQFGVQAIPTLVVLKDGKVVQRFVGVQSADVLTTALTAAAN